MASKLQELGVAEPPSEVVHYRGRRPAGFEPIVGDVEWDDDTHLALGTPDQLVDLKDFGYGSEDLDRLPTSFGQSTTFQLLSPAGVNALTRVLAQVEQFAVRAPRIPRVLRGAALRSRFLYNLAHSEKLLRHLSQIAGCGLVPNLNLMNACHTNFKPFGKRKKAVDNWHCDTVAFVAVIFATNPDEYEGGEFKYYKGTRHEAFGRLKRGEALDESKVRGAGRQDQGFALFQQGDMVPHCVSPVTKGDHRTTVVLSFSPANPLAFDGAPRLGFFGYNDVDPIHVVLPDWLRNVSWRSAAILKVWLQTAEGKRAASGVATVVSQTIAALRALAEAPPSTDDITVLRTAAETAVAPLLTLPNLHAHLVHTALGELSQGVQDIERFKAGPSGTPIWFNAKL